ncbi:hypothetical protein RGU74_07555 [Bacillus cereus]|uniref:hypothetical protein n=1 Tax=Bacillus cereus TaxID=1396 RepID=UPI002852F74D|nr:hypothetical protein [Bacillus cereus]MDR4983559.1 hypothetical protein [Bacillus cereus]
MEQFLNDLSEGFNMFLGVAIFGLFLITMLYWYGRKTESNIKWLEYGEVIVSMLTFLAGGITVLLTAATGKGVTFVFVAMIACGVGLFNAVKKFRDLYKKASLPKEEKSEGIKAEETTEKTAETEKVQEETLKEELQVEQQENKDLKM